MIAVYIILGLIVGFFVGFLFVKQKSSAEKAKLQTELENSEKVIKQKQAELQGAQDKLQQTQAEKEEVRERLLKIEAAADSLRKELQRSEEKLQEVEQELKERNQEYHNLAESLARFKANNEALEEKLVEQKKYIEELSKKFNTEFENIANKILDEKTEKFTNSNKKNLESILKPLGENIDKFKEKVQKVYEEEAKQRFSLGEEVQRLAKMNKVISEEAKNLTRALKGESKTQGRWGEMILESILEKSGLVKGREYFMEEQLTDREGNPLKSHSEGKKMRPDAVIKYPDNRSVIIDSKVSLTSFSRYLDEEDPEVQETELKKHLDSVKTHIVALSSKGYDDYDKALDFVMMFIPSEPAYIAAMSADSNLWNFAYEKRILLLNPTNLITSLKLIVDLWKREYQNQNAIEIANRGAKLYDKFVGFIENLEDVGSSIDKAQKKYEAAYKQLYTGPGNLINQSTQLKNLGLKTKKELSDDLEDKGLGRSEEE